MIPLYTKTNKKMALEKLLASSRQLNHSQNSFTESNLVFFSGGPAARPTGQPKTDREKVAEYITQGLKDRKELATSVATGALDQKITLNEHLNSVEKKDKAAETIIALITQNDHAMKTITIEDLEKITAYYKGEKAKESDFKKFLSRIPEAKRNELFAKLDENFNKIDGELINAYAKFSGSKLGQSITKKLPAAKRSKAVYEAVKATAAAIKKTEAVGAFAHNFTNKKAAHWKYLTSRNTSTPIFRKELEKQVRKLKAKNVDAKKTKKRELTNNDKKLEGLIDDMPDKKKIPKKLSLKFIRENGERAGIKVSGSQVSFIVDDDTSKTKRSFRFRLNLKSGRYNGLATDLQNATTPEAFKKRVYQHLADIVLTEKWKKNYGKKDKYKKSNAALVRSLGTLRTSQAATERRATQAKATAERTRSKQKSIDRFHIDAKKRGMSDKEATDYLEALKANQPYKTKQEALKSDDAVKGIDGIKPKPGYTFVDKSKTSTNYAVKALPKIKESTLRSSFDYGKIYVREVRKMFPKYNVKFNAKTGNIEIKSKSIFPAIQLKLNVKTDTSKKDWTYKVIGATVITPHYRIKGYEYKRKVSNPKNIKDTIAVMARNLQRDYENFKYNDSKGRIAQEGNEREGYKIVVKYPEREITIKNKGVLELINDEEKFIKEFESLKNSERYYRIFETFGFSKDDAAKLMHEAITEWSNKKVSGEDIFEFIKKHKRGRRKMIYDGYDSLEDLQTSLSTALTGLNKAKVGTTGGNNALPGLTKELLDFHMAMHDLLDNLATDSIQTTKLETNGQRYHSAIESLRHTRTKPTDNTYYDFDHLSTTLASSPKVGGKVEIGVSEKAHEQFIALYQKISGNKKHTPSTYETLVALVRLYNIEDLLRQDGVVQNVNPRKKGETKLVVMKLPKALLKDRVDFHHKQIQALHTVFEKISKKEMGVDLDWSDADSAKGRYGKDFPNRKKDGEIKRKTRARTQREHSSAGRVAEAREAFGENSREVYRQKLVEMFTDVFEKMRRDHHWNHRIKRMNLREISTEQYEHFAMLFAKADPESLADHILDQERVQINRNGRTARLYNHKKQIIPANLEKHLSYLTGLGVKHKRREEFNARATINPEELFGKDFEVDTKDKDFKKFYEAEGNIQNNLKHWNKIPGHERVEKAFAKTPFNMKKADVARQVYHLLKRRGGETNYKDIIELLQLSDGTRLKDKLAQTYKDPIGTIWNGGRVDTPIKRVDSRKKLEHEYSSILNGIEELGKKKKLSAEDQVKLANLRGRQNTLRVFINGIRELGFAISTLGKGQDNPDLQVTTGELLVMDTNPNFKKNAVALDKSEALARGMLSHLERQNQLNENRTNKWMVERAISKLRKQGYPEEELDDVREMIFLAVGAKFEGSKPVLGGAGFVIPVGHNFGVFIGLTNKGVVLDVGAAAKLVESYDHDVTFGGGGGVTVGPDGIDPHLMLGFKGAHAVSKRIDFTWLLGAMITSTGPRAAAGIGLAFNEKRATKEARKDIYRHLGLDKIEAAKSPQEKLRLIKENPNLKQFIKGQEYEMDDVDILSLYEDIKLRANLDAQENGKPDFPITAIGFGIAFPPPSGFVGIKIRIGSTIVVRPRRGERARQAKLGLQAQMDNLNNEWDQEETGNISWEAATSGEIMIDENGDLSVLKPESYARLGYETNHTTRLANELRRANLGVEFETIDVQGSPRNVMSLNINQSSHIDQNIVIDHNDPNMQFALDANNNKVMILGNQNHIRIIRAKRKYLVPRKDGGNSSQEYIIITTRPKINLQEVIDTSKHSLQRQYDKKAQKHSTWVRKPGRSRSGADQVHLLSEYQSGKKGWNHEDLVAKVGGYDESVTQEIHELAVGSVKSKPYSPEAARDNWLATSKKAFNKIYKKYLRKGEPQINQYPKILKLLETEFPEAKPANPRERKVLLSVMQHLYFVNVWRDTGSKEKVLKRFKQHNEAIKLGLRPWFSKKIRALGITTNAPSSVETEDGLKTYARGPEGYAEYLIDVLYKEEWKKFTKRLDALGKKPDFSKLENIAVPENMLFYSVSFNDRLKSTAPEAILAGGPEAFTNMGLKHEGTATPLTSWSGDKLPAGVNADTADNLQKVIIETINPRPSMADAPSFSGPLALKLARFQGTGFAIGVENFREIKGFYDKPVAARTKAAKEAYEAVELGKATAVQTKLYKALEEFTKHANHVRDLSTSKTNLETLHMPGGKKLKARFIRLPGGALFGVTDAEVASASYGICTNFSMASHEKFVLLLPTKTQVQAEKIEVIEGHEARLGKDVYSFVLGIEVGPGEGEEADGEDSNNDGEVETGDAPTNDPNTPGPSQNNNPAADERASGR
jgi:hypothetical protein